MKIGILYVIGAIAGLLLGRSIGLSGGDTFAALSVVSSVFLRVGLYVLVPLVFFSAATAACRLVQDRVAAVVALWFVVLTLGFSALGAVTGTVAVLVLNPDRVPIVIETGTAMPAPDVLRMVLDFFPENLFALFVRTESLWLPLLVFAVFFGAAFAFNTTYAGPTATLADSLSRILYFMNSVIVHVVALGMVTFVAFYAVQIRSIPDLDVYRQIITVSALTALAFLALVGLVAYLLTNRTNPARWISALLPPALVAFFSAGHLLTLGVLTHVNRRYLAIPRSIGAVCQPFSVLLSRAGSGMITAVAFILVLRSYSNLDIRMAQIVWTTVAAFGASFVVGSLPGSGVLVALAMVSRWHGRGMEDGFLILQPIAPVLMSIAAVIDTVVASAVAYIIAGRKKREKPLTAADYA